MRHVALIFAFALLWLSCRDFARFEPLLASGVGGEGANGGAGVGGEGVGADGGDSAGGSGGSGGGAGGGVVTGCGKMSVLADDFAGAWPNPDFRSSTEQGSMSITQTLDALWFTSTGASDEGVVASRFAYDLTDSRVALEVIEPPAAGNKGLWFGLALFDDWVELYITNGTIEMNYAINDAFVQVGTVPFDADAHRFVRLRESGGTFYWEASAAGSSWIELGQTSASNLFDLRYAFLEIGMWDEDGDGTASVDNLNLGAPLGALCSSEELVDGYDTQGTVPAPWANTEEINCGAYAYDGALHVEVNSGVDAFCVRGSSRLYDARETATELLVLNVPPPATGVRNAMLMITPTGYGVGVAFVDEQLHYATLDDDNLSAVSTGKTFVAGWVRLRIEGNVAYVDTSDDGTDWTEEFSDTLPAAFDPSVVQLLVGGDTTMTSTTYVDTHFDSFNLPP